MISINIWVFWMLLLPAGLMFWSSFIVAAYIIVEAIRIEYRKAKYPRHTTFDIEVSNDRNL